METVGGRAIIIIANIVLNFDRDMMFASAQPTRQFFIRAIVSLEMLGRG